MIKFQKLPDQPFNNLRASKSRDQRTFYEAHKCRSMDFQALKMRKWLNGHLETVGVKPVPISRNPITVRLFSGRTWFQGQPADQRGTQNILEKKRFPPPPTQMSIRPENGFTQIWKKWSCFQLNKQKKKFWWENKYSPTQWFHNFGAKNSLDMMTFVLLISQESVENMRNRSIFFFWGGDFQATKCDTLEQLANTWPCYPKSHFLPCSLYPKSISSYPARFFFCARLCISLKCFSRKSLRSENANCTHAYYTYGKKCKQLFFWFGGILGSASKGRISRLPEQPCWLYT